MSLFSSGGKRSPIGGVLPRYPATLYIIKVKTTNADIKRYKEQMMTRTKKDESEDLE